MRQKVGWWIILVVLIGVGGVAAWSLREPLGNAAVLVQQTVGQERKVRFAVVGDNHGDNPIYRQILDEVRDQPLDFLLNLADTSEYGTVEELAAVAELEKSLPFPVYHIVGNHDIKADASRQTFAQAFDQPAWGSQDIGTLHLVRLDNADRRVGFSDDQLDWLARDLDQHQGETIVVAYHRPFGLPLAAVLGDDETTASRQTNERLLSILAKHEIAYIFTGHVHTYLPYTLAGIPAVVSGGGGDPAQSAIGGPQNNLFHYLLVTAEAPTKKLDVTVHRIQPTATTE